MILSIGTLLIEAIAALCTENMRSAFTLALRDEISDALTEGINTSDMKELQCTELESKLISVHVYTYMHSMYVNIWLNCPESFSINLHYVSYIRTGKINLQFIVTACMEF